MTHIDGKTGPWEVVIGLEVHAQVSCQAKLFSGAATAFGAEPNSQVSFVDAAFPGMLPVLNRIVLEQAVKTGLGLAAEIKLHSVFERKNYFYPDLPAGYQISQYLEPIVGNGRVLLDLPEPVYHHHQLVRDDDGRKLSKSHQDKSLKSLRDEGATPQDIRKLVFAAAE